MQVEIRESFEVSFPNAKVLDYHITRFDQFYPHENWWTGPWDDDNMYMQPMKITQHWTIFKLKGSLYTAIRKEKTEQEMWGDSKAYTTISDWKMVKLESFPLFQYMKMDPEVIAHYQKLEDANAYEDWIQSETADTEPIHLAMGEQLPCHIY